MKVTEYLSVAVGRSKKGNTVIIEDTETGNELVMLLKDVPALQESLRKLHKKVEKK